MFSPSSYKMVAASFNIAATRNIVSVSSYIIAATSSKVAAASFNDAAARNTFRVRSFIK